MVQCLRALEKLHCKNPARFPMAQEPLTDCEATQATGVFTGEQLRRKKLDFPFVSRTKALRDFPRFFSREVARARSQLAQCRDADTHISRDRGGGVVLPGFQSKQLLPL